MHYATRSRAVRVGGSGDNEVAFSAVAENAGQLDIPTRCVYFSVSPCFRGEALLSLRLNGLYSRTATRSSPVAPQISGM
jgi:hypothetical protein